MDFGFPVPPDRFDQRDEMFKRALWDPAITPAGERFYREVVFRDRPGWERRDYAAHLASWNVEDEFAQGHARSGFGMFDWNRPNPKAELYRAAGPPVTGSPAEMSRMVKAVALNFGASLVGVARVHPYWVYSSEYDMTVRESRPLELPEGVNRAVVLAVEMDYRAMRSESMVIQGVATGLGYSKMAFLADLMASFIRALGYRAVPSGNDTALSVPLAMAAGLGESSRMGLLVTPRYGPRVRICKVFTDLELAPDGYQPFGVQAFCRVCKTCAELCPSQAIPHGEPTSEGHNRSNHHGPLKWYNNHERCFEYWARRRADCTHCIRVCPFNKPPGLIHDFSRTLIRRAPIFNRLLVKMDGLMGYHRKYPIEDFWTRGG